MQSKLSKSAAITRRGFLKRSSLASAGLLALANTPWVRTLASPNDRLVVGVIGCNGRGRNHLSSLLAVPNVEIAYVCDVDRRAVEQGIALVAKQRARAPRGVGDLRRLLDDREVDAVTIATPDHWHAPATILACAAGKHVYVEKPGSHNLYEAELMVAAARRHDRRVQMGNQRRSWPWVMEAIAALRDGELGRSFSARGWYTNHRASIGRGKVVPAPEWLDYSLWQGPAPERPYRDNVIHYNWHWFWHWGTSELGNNGVHALDLARWGLGVDLPRRVICGGNRYHAEDDWETPDTMVANFDFGDRGITWEGRSCAPRGYENASFGVTFFAEKGCLVLGNNVATFYDLKNNVLREIKSAAKGLFEYDVRHFTNFVDAIRLGTPLCAEIEEGQKSTILCHLGNIAYRTGQTVNYDPQRGRLLGDRRVRALARREYRPGWTPKV